MAKDYERMRILSGVGFCLSLYRCYLAYMVKYVPGYQPYCDVSTKILCTAIYYTPYGKTFGLLSDFGAYEMFKIPNACIGIVYYAMLFGSTFLKLNHFLIKTQLLGCLVACLISIYLSYIFRSVLKISCFVHAVMFSTNVFSVLEMVSIEKLYSLNLPRRQWF